MTVATAQEFINSGITGQTFREIKEKFGESFNDLAAQDKVMYNYAIAFAWNRNREHLPVPEAWDKAMGMTNTQIAALFEDEADPEVSAAVDFDSPPPSTTP